MPRSDRSRLCSTAFLSRLGTVLPIGQFSNFLVFGLIWTSAVPFVVDASESGGFFLDTAFTSLARGYVSLIGRLFWSTKGGVRRVLCLCISKQLELREY